MRPSEQSSSSRHGRQSSGDGTSGTSSGISSVHVSSGTSAGTSSMRGTSGISGTSSGGRGTSSGGDSKYVLPLSMAAVGIGSDALFLEVHKDPSAALSDGPNMVRLSDLEGYLEEIHKIEKAVR